MFLVSAPYIDLYYVHLLFCRKWLYSVYLTHYCCQGVRKKNVNLLNNIVWESQNLWSILSQMQHQLNMNLVEKTSAGFVHRLWADCEVGVLCKQVWLFTDRLINFAKACLWFFPVKQIINFTIKEEVSVSWNSHSSLVFIKYGFYSNLCFKSSKKTFNKNAHFALVPYKLTKKPTGLLLKQTD